jgi:hypothetical protein
MKQFMNLSAVNNELRQTTNGLQKDNPFLLQRKLLRKHQPSTDFLQLQQERFKKAAEFVLSISSLLMLSNGKGEKITDLNTVTADVFKDVIFCTATGLQFNYRNVLVSQGNLPRGKLAHTKAFMDSIYFTWDDHSAGNKERARDRAILVAYCEALNLCLIPGAPGAGMKMRFWRCLNSMDMKCIPGSALFPPMANRLPTAFIPVQ